ncbi:hypothetical protein [Bacillus coahuilensis]|uniref:hypothetical protein n=1 Tax=Bacillus coahuilensis TaxID=408580 RepID=UPI0012DD1301|nr:hypothetical protein [Bacillus coahuilensis]
MIKDKKIGMASETWVKKSVTTCPSQPYTKAIQGVNRKRVTSRVKRNTVNQTTRECPPCRSTRTTGWLNIIMVSS